MTAPLPTTYWQVDEALAQDRAERHRGGYSPLYGEPLGYISNPVTGSTQALYGNGMSFEIELPCCDHCEKPLDEHSYCAACEEFTEAPGVQADWAAIGQRINEAVAEFDAARARRRGA